MKAEQSLLKITLNCVDFPGRNFDGKTHIKVGVQKGDQIENEVSGDANQARFSFELRVEQNAKTGRPNFLGPYAHGTPTERSLYLSWGERIGTMWKQFRRAKIHLNHIAWSAVEKAVAANRPIEAIVKLRDKKGEPLCASVKPDNIIWKL